MSVSETGSHLSQVGLELPTAENDIELLILLTLSSLCWDGHAPISLVYAMLGLKLSFLDTCKESLYQLSYSP